MITTKFCTWHDSCSVMACAKICCDLMASNGITARRSFHRIWIAGKKSLVTRAPDYDELIIDTPYLFITAWLSYGVSFVGILEKNDLWFEEVRLWIALSTPLPLWGCLAIQRIRNTAGEVLPHRGSVMLQGGFTPQSVSNAAARVASPHTGSLMLLGWLGTESVMLLGWINHYTQGQ